MDRSAEQRGTNRALWWMLSLGAGILCTPACGGNTGNIQKTYQALSELRTAPLQPGAPVALKLAGDNGIVPLLEVSYGRLPDGLHLDEDAVIRGTPRLQGEVRRFSVKASNAHGEPLEERDYTLAVGIQNSTLASPTAPQRSGDTLTFDGITWNRPISFSYVWDSSLGLIWPLKGSSSLVGQALAAPAGSLELFVAGPDAQGHFDLSVTPVDARLKALAQLTWEGDSNIDLVMLPDPTLSAAPVTPEALSFDVGGAWMARHEIASKSGPGPEVVSFANDAPAGRYALVALKKEGGDIRTQLWLTMKRRDGSTLVEKRFDSLFSDVATGGFADEVAAGRQSFKLLGSVTVSPTGDMSYSEPPSGLNPFVMEQVTE